MKFTISATPHERGHKYNRSNLPSESRSRSKFVIYKERPILSPPWLSQLRSLRQSYNKNTYTIQAYKYYLIRFRRGAAEMNQWNARIKQPYRNQSKSRSHSRIFKPAHMNSIVYYYHFFEKCGALCGLKWRIWPGLTPGYLPLYFL